MNSIPLNLRLSNSDFLRKTVDGCLWAMLGIAPLVLAGRHPVGRFVLVFLIAIAAVATARRRQLQRKSLPPDPLWLALTLGGVLVLMLQLVRLPLTWLAQLSPQVVTEFPLLTDQAVGILTPWSSISRAPIETQSALVLYIAYVLLFYVVRHRLDELQDVERLLKGIAVGTLLFAVLGLAQYLFSNGKFLWTYRHPSRDTFDAVKASFVNQNHFAHFLALGVGPVLWWRYAAAGQAGPAIRMGLNLAIGVLLTAAALTFSRGGVMAVGIAALGTALFAGLGRLLNWKMVGTVAGIGFVVVMVLAIHGQDRIIGELQSLQTSDIERLDYGAGRRRIWQAVGRAIPDYALLGVGAGAHSVVYPKYMEEPSDVDYTHAESGYLQVLFETGWVGFTLLMITLVSAIRLVVESWRSAGRRQHLALVVALIGATVASVVHSVFDFVWYIPACMTVTVIQLAMITRMPGLLREPRSNCVSGPDSNQSWMPLLGTLSVCVILLVQQWPAARAALSWDAYRRVSLAWNRERVTTSGTFRKTSETKLKEMHTLLRHVVKCQPTHAQAHLRLASINLEKFDRVQSHAENAMTISQIRDAALASGFVDRGALGRWLEVVMGENRRFLDAALAHARQAVSLSPMQGRGYVYLSELVFLRDPSENLHDRLIQQALLVRPHDGAVLFAAGQESAIQGQFEAALEFWRRAFHAGPEYQDQLVVLLAGSLPAQQFVATMQPDIDGLQSLYQYYGRIGNSDNRAYTGQLLAQKLAEAAAHARGDVRVRYLCDAALIASEIGCFEAAVGFSRQVVQERPQDYFYRLQLARRLVAVDCIQEAVTHYQWCRRRRTHDPQVQSELANLLLRRPKGNNVQPASYSKPAIRRD